MVIIKNNPKISIDYLENGKTNGENGEKTNYTYILGISTTNSAKEYTG